MADVEWTACGPGHERARFGTLVLRVGPVSGRDEDTVHAWMAEDAYGVGFQGLARDLRAAKDAAVAKAGEMLGAKPWTKKPAVRWSAARPTPPEP